jgi:hypothetical protein
MTRIFFTLASLSIILLMFALLLGLTMGDLNAKPAPSRETLQAGTWHRLTGLAAALGVVLVESIVVTYFIGTSRWCKEVVDTYQLDRAPVLASNRLKRSTFPWALSGMLAVVVVIALGGAADTSATLHPDAPTWAFWHLIGSFLGIVFVGWTYFLEWSNIAANQVIIEQLVSQVGAIRRARGLDGGEMEGHAVHPKASN